MTYTHLHRQNRKPFHRGPDGRLWAYKHDDDPVKYKVDLQNHESVLEDSATLSSVTFEDTSGVTIASITVSSPTVTFTVTGVGRATMVATFSDATRFREDFRWVPTDSFGDSTDYGN